MLRFSAKAKHFSLLQSIQTESLPTQCLGIILPEIRRPVHEADCPSLFRVKVKNHRSCTFTISDIPHSMQKDLPCLPFTILIINRDYFLIQLYTAGTSAVMQKWVFEFGVNLSLRYSV